LKFWKELMPAHNGEIPSTRTTLLVRLRADGSACEIAWHDFHKVYAPVIAGFARRMGARQGEIDDVVQEVMLGFFGAVPEFRYERTRGRFRGYLKTCAWRKLETCLAKRLHTVDTAQWSPAMADADVDAAWERAWRQAQLTQALEIVRTRYSRRADQRKTFDAFEHYALLDRPAEDVAHELAMTVDQVHQAKSRIQKALRESMDTMEAFAD
jgi:RNA polymerase sigma factor (sigma-70 family)